VQETQTKPIKKLACHHHSSNKTCFRLTWYFRDCLKQGKPEENQALTRPSRKLGFLPFAALYVTVGVNFNSNL